MLWSDASTELLFGLPLRLTAANAAYYCLQLSLLAAGVSKRSQRSYREDGVESFPECLNLDFDGLVEKVVQD